MIAANAMFKIFIDVYFAEKGIDPWEIGTSIIQTKNGNLYEVTLNIAKTKDGRNILYDVNKIKKVGHGDVPSDVNNKSGSHINPNFTGSSVSQNEAVVKNKSMPQGEKNSQESKKSLKSRDDEYLDVDKPDIRYSMQKDFQEAFFGREESELWKIVDKKAMERQYEYGEQIHVLLETDDNNHNQKLIILTAALDNDFTIKSVYLLENSDYNIHGENPV